MGRDALEWICLDCGLPNWEERRKCRSCRSSRGNAVLQPPPQARIDDRRRRRNGRDQRTPSPRAPRPAFGSWGHGPPGSAGLGGPPRAPPKPKSKLQEMESALESLRAAGSEAMVEQLEAEIKKQRELDSVDRRPLGAQVDAARAALQRAARRQEAATKAASEAVDRRTAAEADHTRLAAALAELELKLAPPAEAAEAAEATAALLRAAAEVVKAPGAPQLSALQAAVEKVIADGLGQRRPTPSPERGQAGAPAAPAVVGRGRLGTSGRHGTSPSPAGPLDEVDDATLAAACRAAALSAAAESAGDGDAPLDPDIALRGAAQQVVRARAADAARVEAGPEGKRARLALADA